jgi:tetratricopeptide (TPR) repeat protein
MLKKLHHCENITVSVEASYHLGMLYMSENKTDEAETIFQTTLSCSEKDNYYRLSAIAQLAAIYENKGKHQEAMLAYQELAESSSEERWIIAAQERMNTLALLLNTTNSTDKIE